MAAKRETLADVVSGSVPATDDPIWGRVLKVLTTFRPLPDALEPALTVAFLREDMAEWTAKQRRGLSRFYADGRSIKRGLGLEADLRTVGLSEAADIAKRAREIVGGSDDMFVTNVKLATGSETESLFNKLEDLNGELAALDLGSALWTYLGKAKGTERIIVPAQKKGFFSKLLGN